MTNTLRHRPISFFLVVFTEQKFSLSKWLHNLDKLYSPFINVGTWSRKALDNVGKCISSPRCPRLNSMINLWWWIIDWWYLEQNISQPSNSLSKQRPRGWKSTICLFWPVAQNIDWTTKQHISPPDWTCSKLYNLFLMPREDLQGVIVGQPGNTLHFRNVQIEFV